MSQLLIQQYLNELSDLRRVSGTARESVVREAFKTLLKDWGNARGDVRFSNRPFGVKHFQTIRRCGVDVTHGLVLLFGIGTRALPSWDSRTRWNNLLVGLAVRRTAGPSGHANSPHPSSREGHHSTAGWILELPPIAFDPARLSCRRSCLPGPAELGAVNPDAVHDHGQPAGQSHDPLFHTAAPGDLHRPSLEPGPFLRTQHALRCFVKHDPHHLITAARYSAVPIDLAGLILGARQPKYRSD